MSHLLWWGKESSKFGSNKQMKRGKKKHPRAAKQQPALKKKDAALKKKDAATAERSNNMADNAPHEAPTPETVAKAIRADSALADLYKSLQGAQAAAEVLKGCSSFAAMARAQVEKADKLSHTLQETRAVCEKQAAELEDKRAQCARLEQQLPLVQQDAERHKTRVMGEEKRSERLVTECNALRQLNADNSKQIDTLQQKLGTAMDQQNDLQRRLQQALADAEKSRTDNAQLTDTLLRHKHTIQALRNEKSGLLDNFTRMSANLHDEAKGFLDSDRHPTLAEKVGAVAAFRREVHASNATPTRPAPAARGTHGNHHSSSNGKSKNGARQSPTARSPKLKKGQSPLSSVPSQWSAQEVQQWLRRLELQEYAAVFKAHRIAGPQLSLLTQDAYLRDTLKIEAGLHRRKIIKNAVRLQTA